MSPDLQLALSGTSARRWIIDPIDTTKNYVRGIAVFATLIALAENGRLVAGVVSSPALGRRWWAPAGAFLTLARRCARTRGFGDFWSHMLVAEGAIDAAVEHFQ